MLPGLLIVLMVLVFLLYDGVTFFFMFLRGKKPKTRKMARMIMKRRRIIACVLAIAMFCGCIVVSTVATDVRKVFESAQSAAQPAAPGEERGVTRTVYVRTHDGAEELADAKSYTYGIVKNYDDECTQQAFAHDGKRPRYIIWTKLGPTGKKHALKGKPFAFVMEHDLEQVARDVGAETLDMYTPLVPLVETSHFCPDGIHPEGGAQKVIAEITAAKILKR